MKAWPETPTMRKLTWSPNSTKPTLWLGSRAPCRSHPEEARTELDLVQHFLFLQRLDSLFRENNKQNILTKPDLLQGAGLCQLTSMSIRIGLHSVCKNHTSFRWLKLTIFHLSCASFSWSAWHLKAMLPSSRNQNIFQSITGMFGGQKGKAAQV